MIVTIYINRQRKNNKGEMPIYLRVNVNQKWIKVPTGLYTPGEMKGTIFPRHTTAAQAKKRKLDELLAYAETLVLENPEISEDDFKIEFDKVARPNKVKYVTEEDLLYTYIMRFAQEKDGRVRGLYEGTARKVRKFDKEAIFNKLNSNWLMAFEKFCLQTMKVNSCAIHMRNIRAVYNWARRLGETTNYPFDTFRIKHEKTRKRSLSVDELRQLRDFPCEPWQEKYRDFFMLMFYLIGINATDLLHLKHSDLSRGRIEYRRAKTHKIYSIKVEPEAMALINKYKGEKYLLNPLDTYTDHLNWLHHFNDGLKKIGCKFHNGMRPTGDPLFPELSSYWSRHTWGTLAAEIDTPIDVIAHALGHNIPGLDVTSIYIRFNEKKVDAANRAVIDFVNSK